MGDETPDIARIRGNAILLDLVHPPVVGRAGRETREMVVESGRQMRPHAVGLRQIGVGAQVDIVGRRCVPLGPLQQRHVHADFAVGGNRFGCLEPCWELTADQPLHLAFTHRAVENADFVHEAAVPGPTAAAGVAADVEVLATVEGRICSRAVL